MELHFVDQPRLQVLLGGVRAAAQNDVLTAGRFPGLLEGGLDAVGNEREGRASLLGHWLASVVGDDEERHVEGHTVAKRWRCPWLRRLGHVVQFERQFVKIRPRPEFPKISRLCFRVGCEALQRCPQYRLGVVGH